jgi:hypothetical protein
MTRQGRKRDVVACLPPRRCVAACCHTGKSSHQAWAPIGCGEAGAHHACDTSSNFAIVHILPNTQRSEKVKRRKGKRASTVVVASLCRSVRRRSSINQRWSLFCAIVMSQQPVVKLFEGLKGRAVPSVGICKILISNPFGGMRERTQPRNHLSSCAVKRCPCRCRQRRSA